ncbi:unnamed protein product, partial [Symbiodinium sp. KB8]
LWKRLFGSSIAPPREEVKGYCCVQFLVPRRRALLRSRAWYATALAYFASEVSYFELFPWGRLVTWQDTHEAANVILGRCLSNPSPMFRCHSSSHLPFTAGSLCSLEDRVVAHPAYHGGERHQEKTSSLNI